MNNFIPKDSKTIFENRARLWRCCYFDIRVKFNGLTHRSSTTVQISWSHLRSSSTCSVRQSIAEINFLSNKGMSHAFSCIWCMTDHFKEEMEIYVRYSIKKVPMKTWLLYSLTLSPELFERRRTFVRRADGADWGRIICGLHCNLNKPTMHGGKPHCQQ